MSSILTSDSIITDSLSKTSIPSGEYGSPIQTKFKYFTDRTSISLGANVDTEITHFQSTITPRKSGNKILIGCQWFGEVPDLWNKTFYVKRTGSSGLETGQSYTNVQVGTQCGLDTYEAAAANDASTPASSVMWVLDTSIATTSTVTYTLVVNSAVATTLYTNRTISDTNLNPFERFQSWMVLMELSGG